MTLPPLTDKPRLEDVARRAGVSVPTVSRVLNGRSGASRETRQAVLTAMDDLGYERPDRLSGRARGQIGIVVPDLVNPIFPAFAGAISALVAPNDYIPALCTLPGGGVTEDEYVSLLLDQGVRGLIFVCAAHADGRAGVERYHRLRARGIPFVLTNGTRTEVDAPSIANDDSMAIQTAVRHLASLGHRKIGFATGPEHFIPSRRKAEGFRAGLKQQLGVSDPAPHTAVTMFSIEGGHSAAVELLDAGHTGIVCASDVMALGAIRAARSRGLRVPEDVSVVGFDDSPLMAFTDPPLTTLRQPVAAMAEAVVQALLTELSGERVSRTEVLFESDLIVRGSTAAAPG
ncbi:DNA-binding transcriptional regulator, LacI/PurR family [Arthrobacter subterraneus]|uniref:DNA-binding transcriptional regulator, LacI/PurR family n=1 Tax=Arthrobacter subterraneus TaxID=335973 RepID=A0A1G8D2G3_9MICC|nr:LacI family DNA-binding transcriptional regulator [Arthrobacter subterraneus]SDH51872.1 DNA-binding transcriptional regulator, LacI/PurR family [Arthrobacter subterraneus]